MSSKHLWWGPFTSTFCEHWFQILKIQSGAAPIKSKRLTASDMSKTAGQQDHVPSTGTSNNQMAQYLGNTSGRGRTSHLSVSR